MNEFFKKLLEQAKTLWEKWTGVQKIIFFSIIGAVLLGLILLVTFSSQPSATPLINAAINDETASNKILARLDEENVWGELRADGKIYVKNKQIAKAMKAILIREDLIPQNTDPWAIFDIERWTITDIERDINTRRALTKAVQQHIEALVDVDNAEVQLVIPEDKYFETLNEPTTASIIITPKPGSDITTNLKKIKGIVKVIQLAVPGLKEEDIVVSDIFGNVLNDSLAWDSYERFDQAQKEKKFKFDMQAQYITRIKKELERVFGVDRFSLVNLDIEVDMSRRDTQTEEILPFVVTPDNPDTPYDDSVIKESVKTAGRTDKTDFQGVGFSPEGPSGTESQVSPQYEDLSGVPGVYKRDTEEAEFATGKKTTQQQDDTFDIVRITIGIVIDGIWKTEYNKNGEIKLNEDGSIARTYIPVSEEDLSKAAEVVKNAIGYNKNRKDSVVVEHIQFDRTKQFLEEDEKYRSQRRFYQMLLYIMLGIIALVVVLIVYRLVARELERRRRIREEELARQHQAMREAALRSAEEEGVNVEMSVEERARLEMQENAINMAREHPEDVAQLIRTWLMEE